jgi:hypothetical protein
MRPGWALMPAGFICTAVRIANRFFDYISVNDETKCQDLHPMYLTKSCDTERVQLRDWDRGMLGAVLLAMRNYEILTIELGWR